MVPRPYLPRNSLVHGLSPSVRLPSKPFPLLAIAKDYVPLLRKQAGRLFNITQSRPQGARFQPKIMMNQG